MPDEQTSAQRDISDFYQAALDTLHDALRDHGIQREGNNFPKTLVVDVQHWRTAFDWHPINAGLDSATIKIRFKRSKSILIETKQIRISRQYVWVVQGHLIGSERMGLARNPNQTGHRPQTGP